MFVIKMIYPILLLYIRVGILYALVATLLGFITVTTVYMHIYIINIYICSLTITILHILA